MRISEIIKEGIEDRITYIAKQQGSKIINAAQKDFSSGASRETSAEDILKKLATADPMDGAYLQFITKMYVNGDFKFEDLSATRTELEEFVAAIPMLKKAGKSIDINRLKNRSELLDTIESVSQVAEPVAKKQQAKQIKREGAEVIVKGPGIVILKLLTQEAACFYGKGTKWCTASTAADNKFDEYAGKGDIYGILLTDKNRKFQMHYETGSFEDERRRAITPADIKLLSSYPEYAAFLNMLIKKHYGQYFTDDMKTESRHKKRRMMSR